MYFKAPARVRGLRPARALTLPGHRLCGKKDGHSLETGDGTAARVGPRQAPRVGTRSERGPGEPWEARSTAGPVHVRGTCREPDAENTASFLSREGHGGFAVSVSPPRDIDQFLRKPSSHFLNMLGYVFSEQSER